MCGCDIQYKIKNLLYASCRDHNNIFGLFCIKLVDIKCLYIGVHLAMCRAKDMFSFIGNQS